MGDDDVHGLHYIIFFLMLLTGVVLAGVGQFSTPKIEPNPYKAAELREKLIKSAMGLTLFAMFYYYLFINGLAWRLIERAGLDRTNVRYSDAFPDLRPRSTRYSTSS